MSTNKENNNLKTDPTAVSRKKDHIELAFKSAVCVSKVDARFYYEPFLGGHPDENAIPKRSFLGFDLDLPMWVSSMTGGTGLAKTINTNLAKACGEYGMGMGLGSCRSLLFDDERLDEFAVKKFMLDQPLYANLGIAQLEELIKLEKLDAIKSLVDKVEADGLIIHINPLQEWLQPEGDRYFSPPLELVSRLIDFYPKLSIIVKEVGQGFGPQSLAALYSLPIAAVDFAASGGTNFALLELLRSSDQNKEAFDCLTKLGHSAVEMVDYANQVFEKLEGKVACKQTIISGGISNFLDGYYAVESLNQRAIYGQASSFLKYARSSYEELQQHVERQRAGLQVAYKFLTIRPQKNG